MNKKYIIIITIIVLVVISSVIIVANVSQNKNNDNQDETLISEDTTQEISGETTDTSSTQITTASTNETSTSNKTTTNTTKNTTGTTSNKTSTNQTVTNTATTKSSTTQETLTKTPLTTATATGSSYAQKVVDLVNAQRAQSGLAPVSTNNSISTEALVRAQEIETAFSHTRPNGSSFYTALSEYAVPYSGAGENIAYGQSTPEQVMQSWMNSSGHRANILNANYTTIGVGCYQNEDGVYYWVQSFVY